MFRSGREFRRDEPAVKDSSNVFFDEGLDFFFLIKVGRSRQRQL